MSHSTGYRYPKQYISEKRYRKQKLIKKVDRMGKKTDFFFRHIREKSANVKIKTSPKKAAPRGSLLLKI